MKVSEAIDRLEVGDEIWAKVAVDAINFEGGYIRIETTKTATYLDGDAEISLTEPTPIDTLDQEYDVDLGVTKEWLDKGHKGSFEKVAPRYQYPIKTMPALIAGITYRKNLAKVALDKLDKEMYTTPIMRLAQQKYEIYSNVVKLLNDLEPVEQTERVEVTERQAQLLEAYEGETLYALLGECDEYEQELLAKAYLYGYTVKPKRWVVKDSDGEYVYDLHLCHIDTTAHSSNTTQFDILTFTNHAKAEAVAVLVEGTVEEI